MMVEQGPVIGVKESAGEGMAEGRAGILEKARAVSDLVRVDLVVGAGIFVVAGEILALGHLPSLRDGPARIR